MTDAQRIAELEDQVDQLIEAVDLYSSATHEAVLRLATLYRLLGDAGVIDLSGAFDSPTQH